MNNVLELAAVMILVISVMAVAVAGMSVLTTILIG